jgi:hypothetical protein
MFSAWHRQDFHHNRCKLLVIVAHTPNCMPITIRKCNMVLNQIMQHVLPTKNKSQNNGD